MQVLVQQLLRLLIISLLFAELRQCERKMPRLPKPQQQSLWRLQGPRVFCETRSNSTFWRSLTQRELFKPVQKRYVRFFIKYQHFHSQLMFSSHGVQKNESLENWKKGDWLESLLLFSSKLQWEQKRNVGLFAHPWFSVLCLVQVYPCSIFVLLNKLGLS